MVWQRPADVPYPQVWHRFKGRREMPDGTIPTFRVQDMPPEMFDQAVDFMCAHFMLEEPTCKASDLASEPQSVIEIRELWYHALEEKLALVCLREDPSDPEKVIPEIVGMNMTCISRKEDKDKPIVSKAKIYPVVLGSIIYSTNLINLFEKYGVDEYLTAYGLSVKKDFRGQNIGAEILRARIPLCKAVGIKITGTVFTAIESQVLARKVGFKDVASVSYDDLQNKLGYKMGEISTKDMINMIMEIE